MSKQGEHTNQTFRMHLEQQIPDQFSSLKGIIASVFSIGRPKVLQKLIPDYDKMLKEFQGLSVDELSVEEAKSMYAFFKMFNGIMEFVLIGLKSTDEKQLLKEFDTEADLIHFRNTIFHLVTCSAEIMEATALLANEEFNQAFSEFQSGNFSNFIEG